MCCVVLCDIVCSHVHFIISHVVPLSSHVWLYNSLVSELCVCMLSRACVHTCVYACVCHCSLAFVHIHVCLRTCIHVYVFARAFSRVCVRLCVFTLQCIHAYVSHALVRSHMFTFTC